MKAISRSDRRFDITNETEVHKFEVLDKSKNNKGEAKSWVTLINKYIIELKEN